MMPVAPLSRITEVSPSWTLRTRTSGATPQPSAAWAMWPTVSSENSECCMSMKMKSWPVVLAMRAMSPERASRTIMPSDTSPARMRSMTGFFNSTGITLSPNTEVMARSSIPIRRVTRCLLFGFKEPQHRGPFQHAVGTPRAGLIEVGGVGEHVLARHGELGPRRHRIDLRAAGHFELIHRVERLLDGRTAGEEPVVAHDQRVVRAEVVDDPLALVEIDRRA